MKCCRIYHQVTITTKRVNGKFVSAVIWDNCVVAGVPAKIIKRLDQNDDY